MLRIERRRPDVHIDLGCTFLHLPQSLCRKAAANVLINQVSTDAISLSNRFPGKLFEAP